MPLDVWRVVFPVDDPEGSPSGTPTSSRCHRLPGSFGRSVQVTFYRHPPGRPFRQFPAGWCRSMGFPVDVA